MSGSAAVQANKYCVVCFISSYFIINRWSLVNIVTGDLIVSFAISVPAQGSFDYIPGDDM